jgi:hypothetical protein
MQFFDTVAAARSGSARRSTFRRKHNFKEAASQVSQLQFRSIDILDSLSKFEGLIERRNHYVHGTYGSFVGPKEVFQKLKLEDDGLKLTEIPPTVTAILDDRSMAMAVGVFLMALSLQLLQRYGTTTASQV